MEVYITCLEDLDFADDIVLIRSIKKHITGLVTSMTRTTRTKSHSSLMANP